MKHVCPSNSSNFIHKINTSKTNKQKQYMCQLLLRSHCANPTNSQKEHNKWIQTTDDTLPFFRFQHNHFERVYRSAILKLETPSVTVA
jgi:hypothetical protein